MRTKELSQKYNVPQTTIWKMIKRGLILPQNGWKRGIAYDIEENSFLEAMRLYYDEESRQICQIGYNRNIFSTLDTEEKCYWLGFILADGSLVEENGRIAHFSINLGGIDDEHLRKFSVFIEAQQDIVKYKYHTITNNLLCYIQLCGDKFIKDLKKHGIVPKKSGFEDWIETPYPKDFIRGYIDGDGFVRKNLHSIGCVGGYGILSGIQNYFLKEFGIQKRKIYKHGTIYKIEYCAKEDKKLIAEQLWYPGCVSLDRKQALIDEIKKIC